MQVSGLCQSFQMASDSFSAFCMILIIVVRRGGTLCQNTDTECRPATFGALSPAPNPDSGGNSLEPFLKNVNEPPPRPAPIVVYHAEFLFFFFKGGKWAAMPAFGMIILKGWPPLCISAKTCGSIPKRFINSWITSNASPESIWNLLQYLSCDLEKNTTQ
jgi:hypothetical protein